MDFGRDATCLLPGCALFAPGRRGVATSQDGTHVLTRVLRVGLVAAACLAGNPGAAAAERQIKPFVGIAFGGNTTFVDVEDAVGMPHPMLGVNAVLLGRVFGLDADFGYGPGFFESGSRHLVVSSRVMTLTGNSIVAVPRHLAEVGLRPYFVGGGGLMRVESNHALDVLRVADTLPTVSLGGGVTGFLTDQLGVSWEVRHFRTISSAAESTGVSFGPERLSFWRGTMAIAIRY